MSRVTTVRYVSSSLFSICVSLIIVGVDDGFDSLLPEAQTGMKEFRVWEKRLEME